MKSGEQHALFASMRVSSRGLSAQLPHEAGSAEQLRQQRGSEPARTRHSLCPRCRLKPCRRCRWCESLAAGALRLSRRCAREAHAAGGGAPGASAGPALGANGSAPASRAGPDPAPAARCLANARCPKGGSGSRMQPPTLRPLPPRCATCGKPHWRLPGREARHLAAQAPTRQAKGQHM